MVKSELLGVHQRTLYQWDKKDLIELEGGKRLYNVTKFLKDRKTEKPDIIDEQLLAKSS